MKCGLWNQQFMSNLDKIQYRDIHKHLWCNYEFCGNQLCQNHSLHQVNLKVTLEQAKKAQRGADVHLWSSFNLGARWGRVVNATPRPLYPQEGPSTHCIGGWVGPPGLVWTGAENLAPTPGFDRWTVQPVASRYTDWAIAAHLKG
jgi:hypothetical protein